MSSDDQAFLREDARRVKAWHDATCPEGDQCRDRWMHGRAMPMVTSGVLDRFVELLDEARAVDASVRAD